LELESLRSSLAAAQKARTDLEGQLASLKTLKYDNHQQTKIIDGLNKELLSLQRKLRDRTAEVGEQKKLTEQVQTEMISQNLELNMAEENLRKIRAENKDLIKRWMEKMGEEAEEMNQQSNW
jgi:Autophagy protein 16 (ATG16)